MGCARLGAAAKDDGCSDSDARVGYRRTVVRLGPSSVSTGANAERGSPNHVEGCPDRPPRPAVHSMMLWSWLPFWVVGESSAQFVDGSGGMVAVAIAQANAASSRAMATVMTFEDLPAR